VIDVGSKGIRRILVRQVNWVGDAVLTLPALAALDRRFPGAEIVLLAKPWVAGLFAGSPSLDRVLEYRSESDHRGLVGRWRLARALRAEGFDLAVLFPNSLDAALAPWLAGIRCRVGYATDARRILLTHPIPHPSPSTGRHQVERYLDIVRALGGDGAPEPRLAVPAGARLAAERLLADHGTGPEDLVVALNPGSVYGGAKRWPADRFAAVADALVDGWRARILLIGSAPERPILEAVAARMRRPAIPLGGRTDLATLVGLLERAALLVTNDTGAMHIAAAVHTPVVAIFGPTDERETGPLDGRSRVLREPVACSPCLLRECPIDHRCMTRIGVEQVLTAAAALLDVSEAAGRRPPAGRRRLGSPAAFLDRDGTIIEEVGYLGNPDGVRLIPGAVEALRRLREAGYRLVLVTNQAGVARGLISEAEVQRVNERVSALLADAGAPLDGVYYCPHHPEHGPPAYRRDCECRKPKPGLIHQAVRALGLDPARSVIFGDHASDMALARAFPGMRSVLVLTGHGAEEWQKLQRAAQGGPEHVATDLQAATDWFLASGVRQDVVCSIDPFPRQG
jgi:heptosyltransferase-2